MNSKEIIDYLSKYKSRSFLEIARFFKISAHNNKSLTSVLSQLQKEYKIFKNNKDEYYAPILSQSIVGNLSVSLKVHSDLWIMILTKSIIQKKRFY
ncbi:hypothetical protein [Mycoplasmopsis cynos]|uniref:hypothetical protein n=1 Tax=Mycoplasmopsis cynos TaxID=171284 RepID=UPI00220BE7D4|nr:hypothetical protein [Mycoplasmopsis cynos]UWV92061.1 hypothetical protein NWE57_03920 [Mycoplasmopsis cynos]